jgi:transposase
VDTMANTRSGRRRHRPELKAQILAECAQPGASVAAVAMAHGINANLVHKWRRHAQGRHALPAPATAREEFIALPVAPPAAAPAPTDLRIEVRRGPVTVTLSWPLSAAADCAAWLRELLR